MWHYGSLKIITIIFALAPLLFNVAYSEVIDCLCYARLPHVTTNYIKNNLCITSSSTLPPCSQSVLNCISFCSQIRPQSAQSFHSTSIEDQLPAQTHIERGCKLLDFGKKHNHNYLAQNWNHDYCNDYDVRNILHVLKISRHKKHLPPYESSFSLVYPLTCAGSLPFSCKYDVVWAASLTCLTWLTLTQVEHAMGEEYTYTEYICVACLWLMHWQHVLVEGCKYGYTASFSFSSSK